MRGGASVGHCFQSDQGEPPPQERQAGLVVWFSLLLQSQSKKNSAVYSSSPSMAAVIGNPKLPSSVMDRWLWGPMPSAEEEAYAVSELLGCQPLVGSLATKERVMSALAQAECVHFATHISWKLAAVVLTPNAESVAATSKGCFGNSYTIPESLRVQDDASDVESLSDCPPLQEFLLTAADVLDLRLPVKLVVLGSYQESSGKVTADGVVGLTRAFLAAGAQCVLVSLWPVPVAASKVFVQTFYSALLNGLKASAALGEAMRLVQANQQFSHPSNWAGQESRAALGWGGGGQTRAAGPASSPLVGEGEPPFFPGLGSARGRACGAPSFPCGKRLGGTHFLGTRAGGCVCVWGGRAGGGLVLWPLMAARSPWPGQEGLGSNCPLPPEAAPWLDFGALFSGGQGS